LEPRLPIPNRTVKRVCADDSVPFAHAKVGYRHAICNRNPGLERVPGFLFAAARRSRTISALARLGAVRVTNSVPEPCPHSGAAGGRGFTLSWSNGGMRESESGLRRARASTSAKSARARCGSAQSATPASCAKQVAAWRRGRSIKASPRLRPARGRVRSCSGRPSRSSPPSMHRTRAGRGWRVL
jgi:hypothetical protein